MPNNEPAKKKLYGSPADRKPRSLRRNTQMASLIETCQLYKVEACDREKEGQTVQYVQR